MTETGILSAHRQRQAFVYIRQSSPSQGERNTESTRRQYALAARAEALGWHPDQSPSSTRTSASPASLPTSATASTAWPPTSLSAAPASCSDWKSPGWLATTPTGTA